MDSDKEPPSPDSTPLDLSPNMSEPPAPGTSALGLPLRPKADPDPDPERSADREAVALAMVTDLTKATGVPLGMPLVFPPMQEVVVGAVEELISQPRKKQRKRPREDEKVCLVCGDKALAHNFDAITCESCKAFFRRNALRQEHVTCLFKGECPISVQTRRFCPSCRLNKCFSVGMKADLILDEGERKARMAKVTENRAKRLISTVLDSENSTDSQVGSSSQFFPAGLADSSDAGNSNFNIISSSSTLTTTTADSQPFSRHQEIEGEQYKLSPQQQAECRSSQAGKKSGLMTLHYVLTTSTPAGSIPSSGAQTAVTAGQSPMSQSPMHAPSSVQASSSGSISSNITTHQQSLQHNQPQPSAISQPQSSQQHRQPQTQTPAATSSMGSASLLSAATSTGQQEFQHVSRDLLPSDPHMYWRLSEEEKTLLTHLSSVYQDTVMTLPERAPCDTPNVLKQAQAGDASTSKIMQTIFEISEKTMRQLIKFVQRLSDFDQLREDDKIAILQASGLRSMTFRWVALFVVERCAWLTPHGELGVPMMATIFGHQNVVDDIAAFCRTTKTILKNDVTLFALMHCLMIFDPREANLVDRQLINTFRDRYVILLKHYLESEYSFMYSERYLRAIMDKTAEIRNINEKSLIFLEDFVDQIPPLLKQMLMV